MSFAVNFTAQQFVEYSDVRAYLARVGRWLVLREAENSLMLEHLCEASEQAQAGPLRPRLFTVEDKGTFAAAAILRPGGELILTWAAPEILARLANGLADAGVRLTGVYGPNHVPWHFSTLWSQCAGQTLDQMHEERLYQLDQITDTSPAQGHLEPATPADAGLLTGWLAGFVQEQRPLHGAPSVAALRDRLLADGQLYLWKTPAAVAMAACVGRTLHGATLGFIYVPPAFRRRHYGRAVTAGLAQRLLAAGRKMCFLRVAPEDTGANQLCLALGARPVCDEVLRTGPTAPAAPAGPRIQIGVAR